MKCGFTELLNYHLRIHVRADYGKGPLINEHDPFRHDIFRMIRYVAVRQQHCRDKRENYQYHREDKSILKSKARLRRDDVSEYRRLCDNGRIQVRKPQPMRPGHKHMERPLECGRTCIKGRADRAHVEFRAVIQDGGEDRYADGAAHLLDYA